MLKYPKQLFKANILSKAKFRQNFLKSYEQPFPSMLKREHFGLKTTISWLTLHSAPFITFIPRLRKEFPSSQTLELSFFTSLFSENVMTVSFSNNIFRNNTSVIFSENAKWIGKYLTYTYSLYQYSGGMGLSQQFNSQQPHLFYLIWQVIDFQSLTMSQFPMLITLFVSIYNVIFTETAMCFEKIFIFSQIVYTALQTSNVI